MSRSSHVSRALGAIALAALLAGCAARDPTPIVDMKGVDRAKYQQDLAECRDYAGQVRTGREAARGAAGGAILGGIFGAIFGDSDTAERTAGAGAVAGGAKGAARAEQRKDEVVRNCLRGRGYKVLD